MSNSDPPLKFLRESAAALNQLTDEANHAVEKAEDVLNEVGVGLDEYIQVKEANSEPRKGRAQFLECRRINNRHRICVVWTKSGSLDDETCKPWSDSGRTEKLRTVKKLPELLEQINRSVATQLALAKDAKPFVDRAQKILEASGEGE